MIPFVASSPELFQASVSLPQQSFSPVAGCPWLTLVHGGHVCLCGSWCRQSQGLHYVEWCNFTVVSVICAANFIEKAKNKMYETSPSSFSCPTQTFLQMCWDSSQLDFFFFFKAPVSPHPCVLLEAGIWFLPVFSFSAFLPVVVFVGSRGWPQHWALSVA